MAVTYHDFVNVEERAAELGLIAPYGIAILPRDFESAKSLEELSYDSTAPTVRALLKEAGIPESRIEAPNQKLPYYEENSVDWVGPTIVIASEVFLKNPELIKAVFNTVRTYLVDHFKGSPKSANVSLDIVIPGTTKGKYARLRYEGDAAGMKDVPKLIRELRNGRPKR